MQNSAAHNAHILNIAGFLYYQHAQYYLIN